MLRNQATALLRHERIETTVPKAKELRPFVERIITLAKRGLAAGDATNGRALHARRMVLEDIQDREVVGKLFDTIAPRFEGRPGGYTRILRVGFRRGDSAEVAQIELVGSEYNPNAETEKGEASAKKGVGGRIRAAADRLRGKGKAEGEEGEEASTNKAKPSRTQAKGHHGKAQTKGKAKTTSAPRKAGVA